MTAKSAPARARLKPQERRAQLISIGLRLLTTRPIHDMSIDEVAAEAGISRGLLFHYFPTKRDYYVAVVHAGGRRLLLHATAPDEGTPTDRVRGIVDGFVSFVQRRKDNYVAVVRAAAGGDERVLEVFEDNRRTLADRVLQAAGIHAPTPLQRLAVRGWLAMMEEMAISSTADVIHKEDLVDLLVGSLERSMEQFSAAPR
ncbi:TetR/AcrR family transcriptional regulator (plasmid) [Streptomyces sp. WAC00288]|uniref:TetR/AcrR family transcriptional regulator n=1 Tax=unclassified Streptomyces TaxID=2593676 RepID=UPI00078991A3|nr:MULTISPECIES: TetR/AcrR family transcriptional regulator [unclassified Streptomyces]AVI00195.1 TetR/AcrR family transcriptional regulator [Streptomyces sp. WAC00288]KYG51086.1 TetR family transcriptional regulator [Streptomyces sp. WAC04657]